MTDMAEDVFTGLRSRIGDIVVEYGNAPIFYYRQQLKLPQVESPDLYTQQGQSNTCQTSQNDQM